MVRREVFNETIGQRGNLQCRCKQIKKNGDQCHNYAARGHTKCSYHGVGKRMSKHRRYQFKQKKLQSVFEALVADPDRLDLSEELALNRVCLQQILDKCEEEKLGATEISSISVFSDSVAGIASRMAKIEKDLKLAVNAEQLTVITRQIFNVIINNVKDEDVLIKIQEELSEILVPKDVD